MSKYVLRLSKDVPNAGGFNNMLRVGLPEHRDMVNDICICAFGSYEFVPLNRNVLRGALLSNPELTKQLLGIEVKDATIKIESKVEKAEPKKKGEKK